MSHKFGDHAHWSRLFSEDRRRMLPPDWDRVPTDFGPPLEYRLFSGEAARLLKDAGFDIQDLHWPHEALYAYHFFTPSRNPVADPAV